MLTFRRLLADILIAWVITIIVVALAVLVPIAAWLMPQRDMKEIING